MGLYFELWYVAAGTVGVVWRSFHGTPYRCTLAALTVVTDCNLAKCALTTLGPASSLTKLGLELSHNSSPQISSEQRKL